MNFDALLEVARTSQFTPFVVGPVGSGKTTFIGNECKKRGLSLAVVNLASKDAQELVMEVSTKEGKISYNKPEFYDADVVLFDEIDRVTDSGMRTALIQLIWDRELNGNKLKGSLLTAGNQEFDKANTEIMERSTALGSRLVRFDYDTTHKERVAHYESKFGNTRPLQFFEQNPTTFREYDKRLEAYFVQFADNPKVMSLGGLPKGLVNSFKTWCSHMSYTMIDVMQGGREFNDEVTNLKLVNDMVNYMSEGRQDFTDFTNWCKFVNSLNAETIALYFDKLRKAITKDASLLKKLEEYNKQGAFNGQAKYLQTLLK